MLLANMLEPANGLDKIRLLHVAPADLKGRLGDVRGVLIIVDDDLEVTPRIDEFAVELIDVSPPKVLGVGQGRNAFSQILNAAVKMIEPPHRLDRGVVRL